MIYGYVAIAVLARAKAFQAALCHPVPPGGWTEIAAAVDLVGQVGTALKARETRLQTSGTSFGKFERGKKPLKLLT